MRPPAAGDTPNDPLVPRGLLQLTRMAVCRKDNHGDRGGSAFHGASDVSGGDIRAQSERSAGKQPFRGVYRRNFADKLLRLVRFYLHRCFHINGNSTAIRNHLHLDAGVAVLLFDERKNAGSKEILENTAQIGRRRKRTEQAHSGR